MYMTNQQEFNRKLNALWEQCIGWVENDIEFFEKRNDDEKVEFTKKVLEKMQNEYERVKIKTT